MGPYAIAEASRSGTNSPVAGAETLRSGINSPVAGIYSSSHIYPSASSDHQVKIQIIGVLGACMCNKLGI